jgi:hypothetical protein
MALWKKLYPKTELYTLSALRFEEWNIAEHNSVWAFSVLKAVGS